MSFRTISLLAFAMVGFAAIMACGPKCPEVMEKKTPDVLARDDVIRVNEYVEARKSAMAAAKEGDQYDIERATFTVTACELAIKIQMRVIALAESGGAMYEENIKGINKARCLLDEIMEKKGKVAGVKIGKGLYIGKGKGQEIHDIYAAFEEKFGKEGQPRDYELQEVFEKGMKPPKVGKKAKGEGGEEGEAAGSKPDEGGDEDVVGGGGEAEDMGADEEEGEEEGSGGAMDSF